ncbi:MAG: DUF4292 domain-containing protein [Flavobacteriaceae bacterium]|nr:DUF4292 domain-containing protein [Flavobacteriaceae bacterium]
MPLILPKSFCFYSAILFVFLLSIGCVSTKKVIPSPQPIKAIDVVSLVDEIEKAYPKHKALNIRGTALFTNGNISEKINIQLRMIQNKAIWINAVMIVPIARVLVTPETIQFYERFQKTYFEDDYQAIRTFLNNDQVNFQLIENLLLGKSLIDISNVKWKTIDNPINYILIAERTKGKTIPTLFIDPKSFLLQEQRILLPGTTKTLNIRYKNHISVEGNDYPRVIEMSIVEPQQVVQVVIEYKQINLFDQDVAIPFKIPENYKPILLSK